MNGLLPEGSQVQAQMWVLQAFVIQTHTCLPQTGQGRAMPETQSQHCVASKINLALPSQRFSQSHSWNLLMSYFA